MTKAHEDSNGGSPNKYIDRRAPEVAGGSSSKISIEMHLNLDLTAKKKSFDLCSRRERLSVI